MDQLIGILAALFLLPWALLLAAARSNVRLRDKVSALQTAIVHERRLRAIVVRAYCSPAVNPPTEGNVPPP